MKDVIKSLVSELGAANEEIKKLQENPKLNQYETINYMETG